MSQSKIEEGGFNDAETNGAEELAKAVKEGVLNNTDFSREATHQAVSKFLQQQNESEALQDIKIDQFESFHQTLKSLLDKTHVTLKRHLRTSTLDAGFQGLSPSIKNLDEILTFSHKLAYSSFAPLDFEMGDQLGAFKAPAPQAQQFLASKLHDFADQYAPNKKIKIERNLPMTQFTYGEQDVLSETNRETATSENSTSREESYAQDKTESTAIEMELDVPKEVKQEEVEIKKEVKQETSIGFVLNPDLEDSEDNSPLSSEQGSSSNE